MALSALGSSSRRTRANVARCKQRADKISRCYHQLVAVTAVRVVVRITIAVFIVAAISKKPSTKATALETTVAETGVAYLYGPARRCTMAAEIAVVRLDPEVSEAVVAAETGSPKATDTASAA